MQINRLFEIVYVLLDKKTVTARELAERFDVSVRTIYRDVETLSGAGIPVYMSKGRGGGISLLDGFVLDKSVLSEREQNEILFALRGLSAANYPDADGVLSKLSSIFSKGSDNLNWIAVDFSDWSGHDEKFSLIKSAILNKKILEFEYYSRRGEKTHRRAESLQLWFKNKDWYLKAFCLARNDIRLFKISRMKNPRVMPEGFERAVPDNDENGGRLVIPGNIVSLLLRIHPSQAYRVYDEFDERQIAKEADGYFTVRVSYPEDEWVYGFILSFGYYAEVLEPPSIREIISERLKTALTLYEKAGEEK